MARERLTADLNDFAFSEDKEAMADRFEQLAKLMAAAAKGLREAGSAKVEHFGNG